MKNEDSIQMSDTKLIDVPRWTVINYLKGTRANPNSFISVIRDRMCFVAKWNTMTVGGAFVITDNIEDRCWQINAIFATDAKIYKKMLEFIVDEAFSNKRSVIMYKNSKLKKLVNDMGFKLSKNRMKLEYEDELLSN